MKQNEMAKLFDELQKKGADEFDWEWFFCQRDATEFIHASGIGDLIYEYPGKLLVTAAVYAILKSKQSRED